MRHDDQLTALTLRELFEFDLAGYTILRNFIPPEQVEAMNKIIDQKLIGGMPTKFPFLHLDAVFLDLMSDQRVMDICRYLLGKGFRLDTTFGIQFPPTSPGKTVGSENLHAGPYASQGVFRYHWFNNRPQCGLIVFVYFLEAVDEGDGGLVMVPGSHKTNLGIEAREVYRNLLGRRLDAWWLHNPAMQAGDVLLFNEAVMHGTVGWKRTDRRRRNLHYSYSPAYQAQRDYEQMKRFRKLARNETERDLLRGPYALRFDDEGSGLGDNEWRSAVK
jgi:hypothetical protein